jgi:prevent-host-death family protein
MSHDSDAHILSVQASRFKAECIALLDQVERTHITIEVIKRGRPVAHLIPLPDDSVRRPTLGSVSLLVAGDEAYYGCGETWDRHGLGPPRDV